MAKNMEIKQYSDEYFEETFEVVHKTIEDVFPKYYPRKVVDFFHEYHSKKNMKIKLSQEYVLILFKDNKIIGTGSLVENCINRFFILPEHQNKGYGKKLLIELENKINKILYNKITLESSLGAVNFYRKNGYKYGDYKTINLPEEYYLCYLEMEKEII
jgi:GNAT superfamily N-acetyltransferase